MNEPGTLAERVDYRRMAIQRRSIQGVTSLASLPRVRAETVDPAAGNAPVEVQLVLHEDNQRRVRIAGEIKATLKLRCQRCLAEYDQAITAAVAGVVVASDEAAANVPHADEPILAGGDWLDVYSLVSDELLLAVPPVPRCDRKGCRERYEQAAPAEAPGAAADNRPNPFAVLKNLKHDD